MSLYSYGWGKLHVAVSTLAGPQDLRLRLVDAISGSLVHVRPENDLPADIREEFASFIRRHTSISPRADEGAVQATVDSLDDLGLLRASEEIIGFYDTVCRYMQPVQP